MLSTPGAEIGERSKFDYRRPFTVFLDSNPGQTLPQEPGTLKNLENWWISADFSAEPLKKRRILANIPAPLRLNIQQTLEKWLFQSANILIHVPENAALTIR